MELLVLETTAKPTSKTLCKTNQFLS